MSISRVKRPRSSRVPHHRVGAWTLLELAVALVVLGLLVGIAIPMYSKWQERARISQAISDIVGIENSIGLYQYEYGHPPAELDSAVKPIPLDPWGNAYEYLLIEGAKGKGKMRKDKNSPCRPMASIVLASASRSTTSARAIPRSATSSPSPSTRSRSIAASWAPWAAGDRTTRSCGRSSGSDTGSDS